MQQQQKKQKKQNPPVQQMEQKIESWRNVPGDVDDFIFFYEKPHQSQK